MNLEIPDSIKRQAGKCPYDFSCHATGRCSLQQACRVVESISEGLVCVAERPLIDCPYYVLFGDRHFCTCPVRAYLHTQDTSGGKHSR